MITIRSAKPTDARQIAKILMVIFDQMGITELPPADLETRVAQCFADQVFLGEIAETLVAETSVLSLGWRLATTLTKRVPLAHTGIQLLRMFQCKSTQKVKRCRVSGT